MDGIQTSHNGQDSAGCGPDGEDNGYGQDGAVGAAGQLGECLQDKGRDCTGQQVEIDRRKCFRKERKVTEQGK